MSWCCQAENMKYKKPRKLDSLGAVAHKRPTYTKPTQMTKKTGFLVANTQTRIPILYTIHST